MKPMHSQITSVNRCGCCHSKYTRNSAYKNNDGKSATRSFQKKEVILELKKLKE